MQLTRHEAIASLRQQLPAAEQAWTSAIATALDGRRLLRYKGEGVDMLSSLDDAALWDIELMQKTDGMTLGSKALVRAAVPARCMT